MSKNEEKTDSRRCNPHVDFNFGIRCFSLFSSESGSDFSGIQTGDG